MASLRVQSNTTSSRPGDRAAIQPYSSRCVGSRKGGSNSAGPIATGERSPRTAGRLRPEPAKQRASSVLRRQTAAWVLQSGCVAMWSTDSLAVFFQRPLDLLSVEFHHLRGLVQCDPFLRTLSACPSPEYAWRSPVSQHFSRTQRNARHNYISNISRLNINALSRNQSAVIGVRQQSTVPGPGRCELWCGLPYHPHRRMAPGHVRPRWAAPALVAVTLASVSPGPAPR